MADTSAGSPAAIIAAHLHELARDVEMMAKRDPCGPDCVSLTQMIAHERAMCINVALGYESDDPTGFAIVGEWFKANTIDSLAGVGK